jgi:hypothetical protein
VNSFCARELLAVDARGVLILCPTPHFFPVLSPDKQPSHIRSLDTVRFRSHPCSLLLTGFLGLFGIDLAGSIKEGKVSGVQAPKDHLILELEQEKEVVEVPLGSLCGRRRSALHSNQRRAALLGLIPPVVTIDSTSSTGGSAKSSP